MVRNINDLLQCENYYERQWHIIHELAEKIFRLNHWYISFF